MKKKIVNVSAFLLCAMLCVTDICCMPVYAAGEARGEKTDNSKESEDEIEAPVIERIEISTYEELCKFADECHIDSWSVNKEVYLMNDLELSGKEAIAIPAFNGTFFGQGHAIRGVKLEGSGYVTGLFRYVGASGVVRDLEVEALVSSVGERECAGGVAGVNYGILKQCIFNGTVEGKNITGGVVGINENSGQLYSCVSKGRITGSYETGGVAGKNYGQIYNCSNYGGINEDYQWVEEDDEQGPDLLANMQGDNRKVMVFSGVDTGGIAGYSNGIIDGCVNYGNVGYEHTGYNIGGIAGRQSGLVSNSKNIGTINGRKDIGGVIGQMEPYVSVNEEDSLREEVNVLHDMVQKTVDDMKRTNTAAKADLDLLIGFSEDALDTGDRMVEAMSNFADDNLDSADQIMIRMEYVMDRIPAILDNTTTATDRLKDASAAAKRIGKDLTLDDRIDQDEADAALEEMQDSADRLQQSTDQLETETERIRDIVQDSSLSYVQMQEAIRNVMPDYLDALSAVTGDAADALSATSKLLAILVPAIMDASNDVSKDLQKGTEYLQEAAKALNNAQEVAKGIVNYLNAQKDIRFAKLGDGFDADRRLLHSQLEAISQCVTNLSDHTYDNSEAVMKNLKAVSNQANHVFNLLLDRVEGIAETGTDNFYEDVSEEDIEDVSDGCAKLCNNQGVVNGDINVGGIAGCVAIDEEDPEDNAAGVKDGFLGNRYTTKCVVSECVNDGFVTAKKDGAGGIVGCLKMGVLVDCEGYGSVESTEGDYVGGVCGEALSLVRRCYSISDVSGRYQIGGIVGYGDHIESCYSMASVLKSDGRFGAIAGQIAGYEAKSEEERTVTGNYYVSNTLYGIDGISFTGVAEPMTYEQLLEVENLPSPFRHLKVTFRTEDKILGNQEMEYGDSLEKLDYPKIPEREGFYGVWPDVTGEIMCGNRVLTVEYVENVTVIADEDRAETEKPYALVEQSFTQDTILHISLKEEIAPPLGVTANYRIYTVTLENGGLTENDVTSLRLLNPYEEARIWKYEDEKWVALEVRDRGRYLQTEMLGDSGVFCIAKVEKDYTKYVILGAVAGVAFLLLVISNAVKRARKRRMQKIETGQ